MPPNDTVAEVGGVALRSVSVMPAPTATVADASPLAVYGTVVSPVSIESVWWVAVTVTLRDSGAADFVPSLTEKPIVRVAVAGMTAVST